MSRLKLQEKGYLLFPNVVNYDRRRAVIDDIEAHLKGNYSSAEPDHYGMVEMYHYQSMWDVRQLPAVHAAFASVFETEKLWVSIDRTCKKVPQPVDLEPKYGGFIHWDICINQSPRPFEVQGLIALTDTSKDMGGFRCMPELYQDLDNWRERQLCGRARVPYLQPPYEYPVEVVPMQAGDLLIWDSFLPHGNGVNRSLEYGNPRTRYAQYVSMMAVGDERLRRERIKCWATNSPPSGWAFPGDSRMLEQLKPVPAVLTELGEKLLGKESW